MKVNHKAPKKAESSVRERDLQRTIDRLKAANETAVRRATTLTVENESLKRQVSLLISRIEGLTKVPA